MANYFVPQTKLIYTDMKPLKGTKTEANLLAAFAGESFSPSTKILPPREVTFGGYAYCAWETANDAKSSTKTRIMRFIRFSIRVNTETNIKSYLLKS